MVLSPQSVLIYMTAMLYRYPNSDQYEVYDEVRKMMAAYFHPAGNSEYPWIRAMTMGKDVSVSQVLQICTRPEGGYEAKISRFSTQSLALPVPVENI